MDNSGSTPHTIKRKLSDTSIDVGQTGKKTRLQVIIPRLKLSEEQLQRLQIFTTKLQMASVNKEHEIPSNNNGAANTSTTEEVADVVPSTTKPVRRKERNSEAESPVRHRLSDLLGGLSTGYIETYPDCEETYTERIVCELPNGSSCLHPKSVKAGLFHSDEPLPNEKGDSPFLWEKDCITVPCYPDVVSETCQQVKDDFGKTLLNDNGQEAILKTATTEQDDWDWLKENQQLQPGCSSGSSSGSFSHEPESLSADQYQSTVEVMNSLLTSFAEEKEAKTQLEQLVSQLEEKNKELVSECENLRKLVNDFLPPSMGKPETVSRGIQINMDLENAIKYVMGQFIHEQLVRNRIKLDEFRGVIQNYKSLRRGRAVDRATSPFRIGGPSPDVTLVSLSIGCQASPEELEPPKKMASSFCQTDPVVVPGLQPRSSTQNAVATRVQGIVMPSIQGKTPVQPPVSNPKPPNPSQVAHSQPIFGQPGTGMNVRQVTFQPPPLTQGQRSNDLMSKQLYTTSLDTRYPVNIAQASGYNTVGYQTSGNIAASYHASVPNAVHSNSNSTPLQLPGSHQNAYHGNYVVWNKGSATNPSSNVLGHVPQQVRLNQSTGQSFSSLNQMLPYTSQRSATFRSQFAGQQQRPNQAIAGNVRFTSTFPNNEKTTPNQEVALAHRNSVSLNQTYNRSSSSTSSPAQYTGTQQHSASQQMNPRHLAQLLRDSPRDVQMNIRRYNDEIRRQITCRASKEWVPSSRRREQPSSSLHGISKSINDQVATSQRVEGVPSQHGRIELYKGQTCIRLNHPPAAPNLTERVPVMSNLIAKDKEQIQQNLSSSLSSNSFIIAQATPVDGNSDKRVQSHIQTLSHYGEVQAQRVYSESQGTSSNKNQPLNVVNEPHPYVTELPNSGQQSQLMVSYANRVVSISEQRSAPTTANPPRHDAGNQLQSNQTSTYAFSNRSLRGGTVERNVHFSHDIASGSVHRNISSGETTDPKENISSESRTWKTTPNNQRNNPETADSHSTDVDVGHGKEDLSSSICSSKFASTQMDTSNQDDSTNQAFKDPYKIPSKTPGGVLEETVQRLITLKNRIANSENSSENGCALANSNGESVVSVSKAVSGQEDKEQVEPQVVASEELDSDGKEVTSSLEDDNSFQDPYVNLMSPVIPRMTIPRRSRSLSQRRSLDDVGDVSSASNVDCSSYGQGGSDENIDPGASHELVGNEEGAKESARSEQESEVTFRTDPTDETDSRELENGTFGGNDQDHIFSEDTVVEEQQGTCSTKDHEMYTPTDLECATSEPSRLSLSVSNNEGLEQLLDSTPSDTVEESPGSCSTKDQEIITSTNSVFVTTGQSKPFASVSNSQQVVGTSATQNERLGLPTDITQEASVDLDNLEQGECSLMPQGKGCEEENNTCASEVNVFKEAVDTRSDTRGPFSTSLKVEASCNECMSASSKTDDKSDAEEHGMCEMTTKGQISPYVADMKLTKTQHSMNVPLPLGEKLEQSKEISNSLAKNGLNEESASPNRTIKSEEINLLPIPQVALRLENGSTAILMWNVPPNSKVTDINSFEVFALMVTPDEQGKSLARWVKVGQLKAIKLPMACRIRRLLGKKASLHHFIVRAIGNDGQTGPYSLPAAAS